MKNEKYFIGTGRWSDDKWVDKRGNKCSVPSWQDNVYLDDRCIEIKIGWIKKWKRKLFHFLNKITFYKFKKKLAYQIYFRKFTIDTKNGTVIFQGGVCFNKTLVYTSGAMIAQNTSEK